MSVASLIERITTARNTIRNKLITFNLVTSAANIEACAEAINGIAFNSSTSVDVKEGESYTIPAGYHTGSGIVKGVQGGGNYALLPTITVTPTKTKLEITSAEGYYGLAGVTINPIPDTYQDVSSVTATANDVMSGTLFVGSDGTLSYGNIVNRGTLNQTLDKTTTSVTLSAGYYAGGTILVVGESYRVTPSTTEQTINAPSGKLFNLIIVNPIADNYADVTNATASAANILDGQVAYGKDADGNAVELEGTMTNNGKVTETLSTTLTSVTIAEGYHNGQGTVSISLLTKTATPTTSTQNITPDTGKVLSKVTINPIPSTYITTTDATATAALILDGSSAYVKGSKVDGTMPNNGAINNTIIGLLDTNSSVTIPAGYTSGGTVSLTDDIETELAAI